MVLWHSSLLVACWYGWVLSRFTLMSFLSASALGYLSSAILTCFPFSVRGLEWCPSIKDRLCRVSERTSIVTSDQCSF